MIAMYFLMFLLLVCKLIRWKKEKKCSTQSFENYLFLRYKSTKNKSRALERTEMKQICFRNSMNTFLRKPQQNRQYNKIKVNQDVELRQDWSISQSIYLTVNNFYYVINFLNTNEFKSFSDNLFPLYLREKKHKTPDSRNEAK